MKKTINIEEIYKKGGDTTAKIGKIDKYIDKVLELAGVGNDVVLTGAGPVWLYLILAHALHGKARKLYYSSPVTGRLLIFDHSVD